MWRLPRPAMSLLSVARTAASRPPDGLKVITASGPWRWQKAIALGCSKRSADDLPATSSADRCSERQKTSMPRSRRTSTAELRCTHISTVSGSTVSRPEASQMSWATTAGR